MTKQKNDIAKTQGKRFVPGIDEAEDGSVQISIDKEDELQTLYGVETPEVAHGLMQAAMNSLGSNGKSYRV